jgi:hypothetical protein
MAKPEDLIFNPSKGISNSPLGENAFSQCVDNDTVNGVARVNFQLETQTIDTATAYAFTSGGVEYVALSETAEWKDGVAVKLSSTGSLPAGWVAGTVYYLKDRSDISAGYWSVHPTYDDAISNTNQINSSSAGSGTFTVTPIEIEDIIKFQNNRAIDSNGNLWEYKNVGNWELLSEGSGTGVGMEKYGAYVYLFRGGGIDRYNISSGVTTADWQTDTGGVSVLDGNNGFMYIGVGNIIRSYDGSTYNATALTLPTEYSIKSISTLGRFLSIGLRQNKILLWDRVTTATIEQPVTTQGSVEMLIPADNLNYFVIDSGDIYVTNGSTASLIKEFPRHILASKEQPSFVFYPNAWRVQEREIYIGYGSTSSGSSPMGVYQYSLEDGDFKLAYTVSGGATGETDKVQIKALQNSDDGIFFVSSLDGTTNITDRVSLSKRYTGYKTIIQDAYRRVGKKRQEKTFKHTEVTLSEKLNTGQGVRVSYRTDLSESFIEIGTFNTVNKKSHIFDKSITDLEFIQLQAEITTNNDALTPNLVEIRMYE